MGTFLKSFRDSGDTCVLVTAPRGRASDEPNATSAERLAEGSLRVPFILFGPGIRSGEQSEIISLEQVPAILIKVASGEVSVAPDPKTGTRPGGKALPPPTSDCRRRIGERFAVCPFYPYWALAAYVADGARTGRCRASRQLTTSAKAAPTRTCPRRNREVANQLRRMLEIYMESNEAKAG